MRQSACVLLILCLALPLLGGPKDNFWLFAGFTIEGRIDGLKTGNQIYLIRHSSKDTVDIGRITEGKFVLHGKVDKGTEYYYLRLDTGVSMQRSKELLLVNEKLTLEGSMSKWPAVELKGSRPHNDYLAFVQLWGKYNQPIAALRAEMASKPQNRDSLERAIFSIQRNRVEETKAFVYRNNSSYYIPDIIARMEGDFSYDDMTCMYAALTVNARESYFGDLLKKNLDIAAVRERVKPGNVIPNFRLHTGSTENISILELAAQNKITLIDFWASWCGPCRQQVPNLKKVYEAFYNKGFNIVAIALNDEYADWRKALTKEKTAWLNVRDLNNELYKLFSVEQIPAYILIDNKGRLISYYCTGSAIANFGPAIKGEPLYNTIDSLLRK